MSEGRQSLEQEHQEAQMSQQQPGLDPLGQRETLPFEAEESMTGLP